MIFFDSHTHLQFPQYDKDREESFIRAVDAGVGMINVGTDKDTSVQAVELAEKKSEHFVYATVGVHPTENEKEFDYDFFQNLAGNERVVAIGECGVDYYRTKKEDIEKDRKRQKKIFLAQISLAKESGLPLMIHGRPSPGSMNAYEDIYEVIKPEVKSLAGVIIHFFVGDKDVADNFINLGCYFTFGGVITFTRDYDDMIKSIPLDRILLETDAPYVAPAPHRGKRNEPVYIVEVYKKMAEIKNVSLEELKKAVLENNKRAFGIKLS